MKNFQVGKLTLDPRDLAILKCLQSDLPLTVLVDREAKNKVGDCPVEAMMRVMDGRWKGTILWSLVDRRIR